MGCVPAFPGFVAQEGRSLEQGFRRAVLYPVQPYPLDLSLGI